MKKILLLLSLFISFQASAQEGIQFEHTTWNEAKAKAQKSKKLIFVDFYTQWCGPCLNMAEKVFTLGSVGNFYNENFVNLKIDTETGEGIELAKKYNITSFPTFVFVDPKTEEALHISGSSQDKETFLFTGASALNPKMRSSYLTKQAKVGNEKPEFLLNYAYYTASRYNRQATLSTLEKLSSQKGYTLENPQVWMLFDKFISGHTNNLFKELIQNMEKYVAAHGEKAVNQKLMREYNYCPDLTLLQTAPEFNGKEFLLAKNRATVLIRAEQFNEAAAIIDSLLQHPGDFKEELCTYFRFMTRSVTHNTYPRFWQDKCLEYARYMAYNMANRDEAITHFDYASQLEHYILSIPELKEKLPAFLSEQPQNGAKEYSMRPSVLKQKPRRKK